MIMVVVYKTYFNPVNTAPNAYKPFQRSSSKRYSFGMRTPIRKTSDTPG